MLVILFCFRKEHKYGSLLTLCIRCNGEVNYGIKREDAYSMSNRAMARVGSLWELSTFALIRLRIRHGASEDRATCMHG